MKYKIKHDRPNCIGCNACANLVPAFWEMNQDGKADIVNGHRLHDGTEELDIDEADFMDNMDAAEACPVNVIHLIEIGTGKRLI